MRQTGCNRTPILDRIANERKGASSLDEWEAGMNRPGGSLKRIKLDLLCVIKFYKTG